MGPRDLNPAILLVGYFGRGNAGDEWIHGQISKALPAPYLLAAGPRRPFRTLRQLRRASALVFGGGELFQTRTSRASFLYYAGLAWLARIWNKPVFAFAVSADPELPGWARSVARRALRGAAVWARDAAAAKIWGAALAPDSVWARPAPRAPAAAALKKILWVLRFTAKADAAGWAARLDGLAAETGWFFGFLPFHPEQDLPGIEDLRRRLKRPAALETWKDPDEIFGRLGGYDLVVSARFHGLVAAALAGRPALAFPGYAKTGALAAELHTPLLAPEGDWASQLRAAFEKGPADPQNRPAEAAAALAGFRAALAHRLSSKDVK